MKVRTKRILIFFGLVLAISCLFLVGLLKTSDTDQPNSSSPNSSKDEPKIVFRAEDGVQVAARPFLVKQAEIGVIIVHDLGQDRSRAMQFAEELASSSGSSTIAIDLRGHGQSSGRVDDYQNMRLDAEAAGKYLRLEGVKEVVYIGFGFGAHIALAAANEQKSPGAVLASPANDPKGILSIENAESYRGSLLVSAAEDDRDSNRAATEIFERSQSKNRQFAEYKSGGYGIELVYNTDLGKLIVDWLKKLDTE